MNFILNNKRKINGVEDVEEEEEIKNLAKVLSKLECGCSGRKSTM